MNCKICNKEMIKIKSFIKSKTTNLFIHTDSFVCSETENDTAHYVFSFSSIYKEAFVYTDFFVIQYYKNKEIYENDCYTKIYFKGSESEEWYKFTKTLNYEIPFSKDFELKLKIVEVFL